MFVKCGMPGCPEKNKQRIVNRSNGTGNRWPTCYHLSRSPKTSLKCFHATLKQFLYPPGNQYSNGRWMKIISQFQAKHVQTQRLHIFYIYIYILFYPIQTKMMICSIPESVCAPESTTDSLVAPSFFAFATVFGISSYTAGVFWASRCQARSALGRHMQPGSQCLREGGSPGGPVAGDCCHGKCTPEVRKVEKTSYTMIFT